MSDDEPLIPVENWGPLSASIIWRLQRRYFERAGVDAWRQGTVPHFITSNAFIAAAYARLVCGFLADCAAGELDDGFPPLDPAQPIYAVELGSGSGRFAYHFLQAFVEERRLARVAHVPFKLVMTDFTDGTLAFWRAHPSLKPFVESGLLDFARFDAEHDEQLELVESGAVLAPGALRNPLVVIANYFFDGLPEDAFAVEGGRLFELAARALDYTNEPPEDPAALERIILHYDKRPIEGGYYDYPDFDRILRGYAERLPDCPIHFPVAALACCAFLARLSGDRLLLLSADKGYLHESQLLSQAPPLMAVHGSFSLPVNYHALIEYFRNRGGQALHPAHRPASLVVAAFLLGRPPENFAATRRAFAALGEFGPDEFFTLKKAFEAHASAQSVGAALALHRLSGGDPAVLLRLVPALLERADAMTDDERLETRAAIAQAWRLYFHLGEREDLPFALGRLLYELDFLDDAAELFHSSLALYGEHPQTTFNLALCAQYAQRPQEAAGWIRRTLELDPAHQEAREVRIELDRVLAQSTLDSK